MKIQYRFLLMLGVLFLAGCVMPSYSGWTALYEVANESHPIPSGLSEEQIKEAILSGADAAVGWQAKELPSGRIQGTYRVRSHTVEIEIFYTDKYYKYSYRDSSNMKMYCTARDREKLREPKVSGRDTCPGNVPMYIHRNYARWIWALDESIQKSLAKA